MHDKKRKYVDILTYHMKKSDSVNEFLPINIIVITLALSTISY